MTSVTEPLAAPSSPAEPACWVSVLFWPQRARASIIQACLFARRGRLGVNPLKPPETTLAKVAVSKQTGDYLRLQEQRDQSRRMKE